MNLLYMPHVSSGVNSNSA